MKRQRSVVDLTSDEKTEESVWPMDAIRKLCPVAITSVPAQPARICPFPSDLHGAVRDMLHKSNIFSLFSHQIEALHAVRAGSHVLLTTPTASGKTLSCAIPVLEKLLSDPGMTALYVFPLKELCNDQFETLTSLSAKCFGESCVSIMTGNTKFSGLLCFGLFYFLMN